MLRTRFVLAFVLALVLAAPLARPAFADDLAQIEKATQILNDATSTWGPLGAYEKEEAQIAEAEKALAGVDPTGAAQITGQIKDARTQIASNKASFQAASAKGSIERTIATAENYGDRNQGPDMEAVLKNVEAALADGWVRGHLDATVLSDLQKKVDWTRKKFASTSNREAARALNGQLGRIMDTVQKDADAAATSGGMGGDFNDRIKQAEDILAKPDSQKALGDDVAKYQKQIADLKALFAKNSLDYQFTQIDKNVKWLAEFLEGKMQNVYTNNVEDHFKWANEGLAKVPASDPRAVQMKETLAGQRKQFDAGQAQGAHDDVVKPMVDYWPYLHENYGKDSEGWEAETTPPDLSTFLHQGGLGCPKTLHLLGEIFQRFYGDERVTKAIAQYPNDPQVKKVNDEAKAIFEKAAGKVCAFANKLLDEGDKMPAGKDRESFRQHFYNLKVTLSNATKGFVGAPVVIARIDALDKRFGEEKKAGEEARAALVKKIEGSVNASWPELSKPWVSKAVKIDASEALKNIGSWKGKVIHFSGGARGVDLNRSGWDWGDDYWFIVEVDGVPICGNFDSGLAEAFDAVEKQTGVGHDEAEEVYGVIDGTCKARRRVQNPIDHNKYYYRDPEEGVRFRIVAIKAVTVAVAVGQGTNLSKLPEYKEISVTEAGSSTSGAGSSSNGGSSGGSSGGGHVAHWAHRFIAWGMCALLALAGALALANGASKFVPQVQEQKVKLGDYLGYAGAGFAALGFVWFGAAIVLWVLGMCEFGSLPSVAMIFAGAACALELARSKGKIKEETAAMIQPIGLLFGAGAFMAAGLHFLFWDKMFL